MSGWNPNIANPAPGWVEEAEKALDLMGHFESICGYDMGEGDDCLLLPGHEGQHS